MGLIKVFILGCGWNGNFSCEEKWDGGLGGTIYAATGLFPWLKVILICGLFSWESSLDMDLCLSWSLTLWIELTLRKVFFVSINEGWRSYW